MAAQEGKDEVVKVLLESQANANMQPEVINPRCACAGGLRFNTNVCLCLCYHLRSK